MSDPLITGESRPRLPRGVRLRHDEIRKAWVLLAPERVINTNAIAVEILKRCTGEHNLNEIVDDLAQTFNAERARIEADVRALLSDLALKRMMDL